MKIISLSFVFLLALLGLAHAQSKPFDLASPDQKYTAIYAPQDEPPFKIAEKGTQNLVATMDDERVGNRGLTAMWAPNGQTLVVLVEFRLGVSIEVFRLREGHFDRTEGPNPPEDFLTLSRWVAPDKLQLKGEKKTYTLTLTDNAAKFNR